MGGQSANSIAQRLWVHHIERARQHQKNKPRLRLTRPQSPVQQAYAKRLIGQQRWAMTQVFCRTQQKCVKGETK